MADADTTVDEPWRLFTHSELEREYSPSSCVPNGDLDPFIQAYVDLSEQARTQVKAAGAPVVEVRYGTSTSQTIDVAIPTSDGGPMPLLVFIHGGYWQQLSKRESFFAATASVRHGIGFAAIDYTLAPVATLDQIVAECHAALAELRANAHELGFDPDRIFVAGSSAGAHLAAMVALGTGGTAWRPAGCCLVSGIFDLRPLVETSVNDALKLDDAGALRNSPLRKKLAGFPKTVIAVGSNETAEFKRQSTAMATALGNLGVSVEHHEIAGRNHFDVILELCDAETPLGAAVLTLIRP